MTTQQVRSVGWVWLMAVVMLLPIGCGGDDEPQASPTPSTGAAAPPLDEPPAPIDDAEPEALRVGLWWQVSGDDAGPTVHLIGSFHVAPPGFYPLPKQIERVVEQADLVVFEIPMDAASQQRTARAMLQAAQLPPGRTQADIIGGDLAAELQTAAAAPGRAGGVVMLGDTDLQPWFDALLLSMQTMSAAGFNPEAAMEAYLHGKVAVEQSVASLETIDQQVALFTGMTDDQQRKFVAMTLEELPRVPQIMQQAFAAWNRGDAEAFDEALLASSRTASPLLYERMFTERNRRMAERIIAYREQRDPADRIVVVVGTGHLVGPDSIITFLTQRDLQVEQIETAAVPR